MNKWTSGNLDANLILRQHNQALLARYVEIEPINPKFKQKEIAKELGYSIFTLQRYRSDIKMQSPYKSNNPKKLPKTSNDLERP